MKEYRYGEWRMAKELERIMDNVQRMMRKHALTIAYYPLSGQVNLTPNFFQTENDGV